MSADLSVEQLLESGADNVRRGHAYCAALDYKQAVEKQTEALHRCRGDYHAKVIAMQARVRELTEALAKQKTDCAKVVNAVGERADALAEALRVIADASVNGADDGWELQSVARSALAAGETAE